MLTIKDLTYRIGGRTLLDGAGAAIAAGHHVGLIGRNGTGKSTLLKLIAGELQPDAGSITRPRHGRLAMLSQDAPDGPQSLLETVLAADTERSRLLAEAEASHDGTRIAEIHARLEDIDAHRAPARAAEILAGLGFDTAAQGRACADFSGGWRMRVALAATLFLAPDLLLLDEPTNHLDFEATVWLEQHLKTYRGTILLVSHDRELLNTVVDRIIHIDANKLVAYSGNYDRFERTRAERLEHQAAGRAKQLAERRHMQSFIDRFRYKASKARQAQSRIKALARMEPIAAITQDWGLRFDFPNPPKLAPPILSLEDVSVGYDGKAVLRKLDLRIDPDDRIALLGANGNGKSTLVKLLSGRLAALSGTLRASSKLKVGYFAQHQADELDLQATALRHLLNLAPQLNEGAARKHLGRFGFSQERAEVRIGALSGGEKARLLIALTTREAPHILLLDEPTNHLDIDAREALIRALNEYEGAVVLISHDPHLVELVAERLWLVAEGTCVPYDGDLEEYRALTLAARPARANGDARATARIRPAKAAGASKRPALGPLQKDIKALERTIERCGGERKRLEAALADPALYRKAPEKSAELTRLLAAAVGELASAEAAWLAAQEALEEAKG